MNIETDAVQGARAVWPILARASGRDPSAYAVSLIAARIEGAGRARVVAVATGADRVVIKFRMGGAPDAAVQAAQAHRAAFAALRDDPDCAAPEVFAVDGGSGAMALGWVEGVTLSQTLARQPAEMGPLMGHVGRWMAALHRRGPVAHVPFDGDWMLRRLDKVARRGMPGAATFAACRTALADLSETLRGRAMPKAVIHGDLTLQNLIWDGRVLTGIDFENIGQHPVARDAALLLCDVAVSFGAILDAPAGDVIPQDVMAAFLTGLGQDAPDADILRFFIGLRLLHMWTRVPKRPADRSARRARDWHAIRLAASRVLLA